MIDDTLALHEGVLAAFCTKGGTCACTSGFHGPGCTKNGRGHQPRARLSYVPGNVKNMVCNHQYRLKNQVESGLISATVLNVSCSVSRSTPQKIILSHSFVNPSLEVGDVIQIEDQTRTVTEFTPSQPTILYVDSPFEERSLSTLHNIFPQFTPILRVGAKGVVSCTVSDRRMLLSHSQPSCSRQGSTRFTHHGWDWCNGFIVGGSKSDRPDQYGREVSLMANLWGYNDYIADEKEVEIGDRISLRTGNGKWETRTVDSVTYGSNGLISGFTVSEPYEEAVERSWRVLNIESNTAASGFSYVENKNSFFTTDGVLLIADFSKLNLKSRGETVSSTTDDVFRIIQQDDFVYFSCRNTVGSNTNSGLATIKSILRNSDSSSASSIVIEFDSGLRPASLDVDCTFTTVFHAQNVGEGTVEAEICSRRGVCEDDTGECTCFKGFMGHDCSRQNSLSM